MRLYDRGIRRRLAPMLGNDRRRIEMAYALQFSLPGTPVIRYGDEIGMGEDLRLPERNAIRTPMQWSAGSARRVLHRAPQARPAPSGRWTDGEFGFEQVNVEDQQLDPGSLLAWFQRALSALRECPEMTAGSCRYVDMRRPRRAGPRARRAERGDARRHQPRPAKRTVDLVPLDEQAGEPLEVFADRSYPPVGAALQQIEVAGYGYRWIRLRRSIGGRAGLLATAAGRYDT